MRRGFKHVDRLRTVRRLQPAPPSGDDCACVCFMDRRQDGSGCLPHIGAGYTSKTNVDWGRAGLEEVR